MQLFFNKFMRQILFSSILVGHMSDTMANNRLDSLVALIMVISNFPKHDSVQRVAAVRQGSKLRSISVAWWLHRNN